MFGKKKKVEENKEEAKVETSKVEASLSKKGDHAPKPAPEVKHELTQEEKDLVERIRAYKKYSGVFNAQDFANLPETRLRAEEQTLQFAILAELQDMNRKLDKLVEQNVEVQ